MLHLMRHTKFKQFVLLLGLLLPAVWCGANDIQDGFSHITIQEAKVQSTPKGSTIQAFINGHTLTVVFTENLGEVAVDITSVTGGYVQADSCLTPNGLMFYIPDAGDYIVTFTLPNGDEYYGEFTIEN